MRQKLYLETTIPSYLVARPSRDLLVAGHQQITQTWWRERSHEFEIYISELVIIECEAGDPEVASRRLSIVEKLPLLEIGPETLELARILVAGGPLPKKAENDAFHIAVAAVNAMDFLLSWNLKHIANASMRKEIEALCRSKGYEPPVICTPDTLMAEESGNVE